MKNPPIAIMDNVSNLSVNSTNRRFGHSLRTQAHAVILKCFGAALGILICLAMVPRAQAQVMAINNQITNNVERIRVTVPLNYSGVVELTNLIRIYTNNMTVGGDGFYHIDPVAVTVTNLPAGATFSVSDLFGNPRTIIDGDTNNIRTNLVINLTLNNVAQGIYTFYLVLTNSTGTNTLPANKLPFVLQVAHIWNGSGSMEASFNVSNNWANASSWLGGVPGANDDVVFGDVGAQTNTTFTTGISFTNASIDSSVTIASLRFAQSVYYNANTTNSLYHTIRIAPSTSLTVSGTNGFSILRDYLDELADPGIDNRTMGVNFSGGGALIVSNANANFSILVGSVGGSGGFGSGLIHPTLNMSNLNVFVSYVNQMGLAEYQLYPNYRELNNAFNQADDTTNDYSAMPRRFTANVYLAKTNIITAWYQDPNNYSNEFTRSYGVTFLDNEQSGNGSSDNNFFFLGQTNKINADGVCFVRTSAAIGNTGIFGFAAQNSGAVFRNTNGTSRMSVFTVSDDGGTNMAGGNIKAAINFGGNNGYVDILADRLYISRDRTLISSNENPNVQGDLIIGKGIVDVNTAILGYQEHSNKIDWTSAPYNAQAYLNYCQGRILVTNGATIRINKTLTLGYTADPNPWASANQSSTFGQVVISNSTVTVSNIICDGGLNYTDNNHTRANNLLVVQSTLVVSNTIGSAGFGVGSVAAWDPAGLPLDTLTLNQGTNVLFVTAGKTNIFTRNLTCQGTVPSVIKIASLSGVTVYPTNIPIIAYQTVTTPLLAADVSAVPLVNGLPVQGSILNDTVNGLITLYLATNAPRNLIWSGGDATAPNSWDLSTTNWVPAGGGAPTKFGVGDIATFNDSSSYTNVNVTDFVVPNQNAANIGVTISNNTHVYTFADNGGAIIGTAQIVKTGTNSLVFNAHDTCAITLLAGELDGASSQGIGALTVTSNSVVNFSGTINGGLTSTGMVTIASGGVINGSVSIQGGWFVNSGNVNCPLSGGTITIGAQGFAATAVVTNYGTITLGNASSQLWDGSTMANFGTIHTLGLNNSARLFVRGIYYGTGNFNDDAGGLAGTSGRLNMAGNGGNSTGINALVSPGAAPSNSIGSMNVSARLDLHESSPQNTAGRLLIEVDPTGGPGGTSTNDTIYADKWNNIGCIFVMTNLNGGSFVSGQQIRVFRNNNGDNFPNFVDTPSIFPLMQPTMPAPGLQWNLSAIQVWGSVMITNSTMVWDGVSSTSWDTNGASASWKPGVYHDNQGAIFDDSASGSTTVTLNSPVAPAGINVTLLYTNYVTNLDMTITTNIFQPVTNTPSFMPGIIVSNAGLNYTFVQTAPTNKITGMTGIYKTGPGTLMLLTLSNDFTGGIIIDQGTLAYTNISALGNPSPPGQRCAYAQVIINNNATLKDFGTTNQDFSALMTIGVGGATIEVSSNNTMLPMKGAIVGSGGITKTGPGILTLKSTGNVFAGDDIITAGTLRLEGGACAGSGNIDLADGTTLELTNSAGFTLTNGINVPSGAVAMNLLLKTSVRYDGLLAGAGTVTISNPNQFTFNGPLTNFSGMLSFGTSSGYFQINNSTNSNPCTGSPLATFDLGTGSATVSNLNGAGITYDLGALAGGPNTILAGRATNNVTTNATTIYRIGANGNSTTFSGKIVNGVDAASTVSVVKVGSGALLLDGPNTFSGGMTVSNGVLGGTGSLASALTITPNGTLSPGASIGTFTVSNNATLGGTVLMELNRANSPATNDLLVVTGTINATGGALIVTNVGPDIYNGSTFTLFSQPVTGFSSITLPTSDPSNTKTYTWQTNLASSGSITLISGGALPVNSSPTNITFGVTNGTLTLSWPADHTGWRLQAETNALSIGLNGNTWVDVVGANQTNVVNIPVSTTNGSVFYRMIYP